MKSKHISLPPGLRIRHGRYHVRFSAAGIEYAITTGLKATELNLKNAMRRLEQERARVEVGGLPQKLAPRPFNSAIALYNDWKKGESEHPETARRIKTSLTSACVFFESVMMHRISAGNLEDYKAWRRSKEIKPITLRHDLHALSGLFQYAVRQNWCQKNPVKEVSIPSAAGAEREHVVTPGEESAYFMAATVHPLLHDLGRVVLETGMRPSEVLALEPADISASERTVRIRKGKSKAARRTLGLTKTALEILEHRAAGSNGGRLFLGKQGGKKHLLTKLDGWHGKIMADLGMAWTIYELRHTFATRKAQEGCPLPTLAAILGHSGLRTVGRYIHVEQEQIVAWSGASGIRPEAPSDSTVSDRSRVGAVKTAKPREN